MRAKYNNINGYNARLKRYRKLGGGSGWG